MDDILEFRKKLEEIQKKSAQDLAEPAPEQKTEEAEPAAPAEAESAEQKHKTENSIWVGNLDQSVTEEKLDKYFCVCGQIVKITIPTKAARLPAKYAYIEFGKSSSVDVALKLNDSLFCGKNIEVKRKRDNVPGKSQRRRRSFRRY